VFYWDITWRVMLIFYRSFGTKYRSYFQRSRIQRNTLLFEYLDPLNGTNRLFRNVDNVIPLCAPKYQIVAHIFLPPHRKTDIAHFNSLSIAISFIVRKFNCCSIFTCIVIKRRAYVPVRAQLRTWLETFCYILDAVAFVWSET
jgi:hypothetical protein